MQLLIKIISSIIVLLGIVHIGFAFPLHMNAETLWFTGAGMAIIFAGLLNFVALDRGGSKFAKGIAVFLLATLAFSIDFANAKTTKS